MPRHFFYSIRLFAGGFPFAVSRIVLSHKKQVWSHEIHYLHFFVSIRVHSWFLLSPAIFFVFFVLFVVKSFF